MRLKPGHSGAFYPWGGSGRLPGRRAQLGTGQGVRSFAPYDTTEWSRAGRGLLGGGLFGEGEAGEVDHDAVAAQVHRLIDGGIHGIVPNGTVGEGGSLSRDERRAVIETVVAASAGRVPVCAGVSAANRVYNG